MAWNEPGGSGNKDPWGNRKNEQGPPDLDEIIKKLQSRFSGLFGGGGGSGRKRTPGGSFGLGFIAAVVLVIWALSGIYIVDEGKQGVVLQFGAFHAVTKPGPHWYPRFIQSVDIVEVDKSRSLGVGMNRDESLMLTKDENIVDVKFEVQYRVKDAKNYLFSVVDPDSTIRAATESALREIVGTSAMNYVLERNDVAELTGALIQNIVDRYDTGLLVEEVNLVYSEAPEEVKPAFDDVNSAEQDRDRFIEEARKYQNQIVPIARGEAARIEQEAEAYKQEKIAKADGDARRFNELLVEYIKAPEVTRERLYLEAMEDVLANNSKVMIDVKEGNNLLYIPIDQIAKQRRQESGSDNGTDGGSTTTPVTESENSDLRDRSRIRTR